MNRLQSFLIMLSLLALAGCVSKPGTNSLKESDARFVRKVDCRERPQASELAAEAREIGDTYYPQVLALLVDDKARLPQHFDIIFKNHLHLPQFGLREPAGYVDGTTIYLDADVFLNPTNADWIGGEPGIFKKVLVHEMAHVAQHYTLETPGYWQEGIAEFVRYKLGVTNGFNCPECEEEFPAYTSGYACAGAFLLYLDAHYGTNLVRQLNSELRHGTYSDAFFVRATGVGLNDLWHQFQTTPAYTPTAARINQLQEKLGYQNSVPPPDVIARFNAYVKDQPEAEEINAMLAIVAETKGLENDTSDIQFLTRVYLYFTQPGGPALGYLIRLRKEDRLPGISKADQHGSIDSYLNFDDLNPEAYPNSQTFRCHKTTDSFLYNYTVARQSPKDVWKLKRAWRTDKSGIVVEEYPVQ